MRQPVLEVVSELRAQAVPAVIDKED